MAGGSEQGSGSAEDPDTDPAGGGGVRYLCQVPDGAVKEAAAAAAGGDDGSAAARRLGNGAPWSQAGGGVIEAEGQAVVPSAVAAPDAPTLHRPRQCYICKVRPVHRV